MYDVIYFKTYFNAENEIRVEMTIANQFTGELKSPVSVSDEKGQANQDCVYFKHLYLFLTTKI